MLKKKNKINENLISSSQAAMHRPLQRHHCNWWSGPCRKWTHASKFSFFIWLVVNPLGFLWWVFNVFRERSQESAMTLTLKKSYRFHWTWWFERCLMWEDVHFSLFLRFLLIKKRVTLAISTSEPNIFLSGLKVFGKKLFGLNGAYPYNALFFFINSS